MPEVLAKLLDLKTAWKRVKEDIRTRVFLRHPYSVQLIETDLDGWLSNCQKAIRSDIYVPRSMFVCDIPKGKGLVRPGSHLSYTDRLVYTACVGACFPAIHDTLKWSQGIVDFSYRLSTNPKDSDWLRDRFTGWQDFREHSVSKIDKGALYVVMADISAFYENVDIGFLISDIKQTGAPLEVIEQIGQCLNKWAQVTGRVCRKARVPPIFLQNCTSIISM